MTERPGTAGTRGTDADNTRIDPAITSIDAGPFQIDDARRRVDAERFGIDPFSRGIDAVCPGIHASPRRIDAFPGREHLRGWEIKTSVDFADAINCSARKRSRFHADARADRI